VRLLLVQKRVSFLKILYLAVLSRDKQSIKHLLYANKLTLISVIIHETPNVSMVCAHAIYMYTVYK